jgi:hypothetical protein
MTARKRKRAPLQPAARKRDYWCLPQKDGHATLYFRGHTLIPRAEYVGAVGPDDCDPHVTTGRGAVKRGAIRRRGPKTRREQMKRM